MHPSVLLPMVYELPAATRVEDLPASNYPYVTSSFLSKLPMVVALLLGTQYTSQPRADSELRTTALLAYLAYLLPLASCSQS
mmetsp:Transcript_65637/g.146475  ORF Transcript_65637/g.146475 Transcript_65637/m.146475 type:complete len:82 (-) Transcript_65637:207-452(-)